MIINIIIFSLMAGWGIWSALLIQKLHQSNDVASVNGYLYDSIPAIFTTLGILGTFAGIYQGLYEFDVENITESIPTLLEGLKTAFITSIVGIVLSIIFSKWSKAVLHQVEKNGPPKATSELNALSQIAQLLTDLHGAVSTSSDRLEENLVGTGSDSLSIQLRQELVAQKGLLLQVQQVLAKPDAEGVIGQLALLRSEQEMQAEVNEENVRLIVSSMAQNNELLSKKFDEFSKLLAKNNTEALVQVMKQATEDFNAQMKSMLDRLIQENFQELNASVNRMNTWQMENKEMVATLTTQYVQVSQEFAVTSATLATVAANTKQLTDENSHLTKLIAELQEVIIKDEKFKAITTQLESTINTLQKNTAAFDETSNKLNVWVRNQRDFGDSVAALLIRLKEIEDIKDINKIFWTNTKAQLNEAVSILANASSELSSDLESINEMFYAQLNDTLKGLDAVVQRALRGNR